MTARFTDQFRERAEHNRALREREVELYLRHLAERGHSALELARLLHPGDRSYRTVNRVRDRLNELVLRGVLQRVRERGDSGHVRSCYRLAQSDNGLGQQSGPEGAPCLAPVSSVASGR